MGECLKIVIKYLPVLLGVMSVISFTLMGIDKAKARRGSRRIPEKTLFLFTLLGGGIGGEGGQQHDAFGQGGIKALHGQDPATGTSPCSSLSSP